LWIFYTKADETNHVSTLKVKDKEFLKQVVADYGQMNNSALIKHIYLNYPFYAVHSSIVNVFFVYYHHFYYGSTNWYK